MTDKSLGKLLYNPESVFNMSIEDFQLLFPAKLRSAIEVDSLHKAIQDRQYEKFKIMKDDIKEYLQHKKATSNPADTDYVLEMMETLHQNVKKDREVLGGVKQKLEDLTESYFTCLEMQASDLEHQCNMSPQTYDPSKQELQSHIELLNLPS